jgi:tetratricopeptide (TPR) repeat protein
MKLSIPALVVLTGVICLYPLQKYIDSTSPRQVISDESLYLASGPRIKKMSMGISGLLADIYWIRTTQYFGRKVIDAGGLGADTKKINMALLTPLLNIVVTLDPQEIAPYRFGAIFLPDYDPNAAIDLLQRGIEANPAEWALYQDLGFIYWHLGKYSEAAETYDRGSLVPGAPYWMKDITGLMRIRGGSREVARAIYREYLQSSDKNIRAQAEFRLHQLDALDQIDALNQLVSAYNSQRHSCPPDLRMLSRWIVQMRIPLNDQLQPVDPDGDPYVLDSSNCQVRLSPGSRFEAR